MVKTLGDAVQSYKVGLQLLPLGGAEFGQELKAMGKQVFMTSNSTILGQRLKRPRAP